MSERLSPQQIEGAKNASRLFEKYTRIVTYPRKHSVDEILKATKFLLEQHKNFAMYVRLNPDADAEVMSLVFLGLFHHRGQGLLETRFKPFGVN